MNMTGSSFLNLSSSNQHTNTLIDSSLNISENNYVEEVDYSLRKEELTMNEYGDEVPQPSPYVPKPRDNPMGEYRVHTADDVHYTNIQTDADGKLF